MPDDPAIAAQLVARFALEPHPEGGWYREIHRSTMMLDTARGPRSALTSIHFLLERAQTSRWHVVAADETWHFADGAPLELLVYQPQSRTLRVLALGAAAQGFEPTGCVCAGEWQAARSRGAWSLAGCDVAPGFDFEDFQFVAALPGHEAHFSGELAAYAELL
jgi:uncharacterized protein